MTEDSLSARAEAYLRRLCTGALDRRVGSPGNRAATDFFSATIAGLGFHVDSPSFDCIDWCEGGAHISVGGTSFDVFVNPYSLGGYARGPLAVVSTLDELETADVGQCVVLLRGDLAREPLMPKNFPFYNPDRHQRIIALLEVKMPQAIVGATSRNPEMAGAVYPFPLFEDGDFDIPSVTMTEEEGERLAKHSGEEISLEIRALRSPARGCNVVARRGDNRRRVVVLAHVDSKEGTPGALDNASGVVVLLLLADLLSDYEGGLAIELVALNGEDYYSSPGQKVYLSQNAGRFDEIILGINLDGAGYKSGKTAYSLYGCPSELGRMLRETLSSQRGLVEGEPWYQGDHALFLMNEVPTVAMTSERMTDVLARVVHTPSDRPEIVDVRKLVDAALGIREVLMRLEQLT